jgi:hypothetical protein
MNMRKQDQWQSSESFPNGMNYGKLRLGNIENFQVYLKRISSASLK